MVKCSIYGGSYFTKKKEIQQIKDNFKLLGVKDLDFCISDKRYRMKWNGSPKQRLENFYKGYNSNSDFMMASQGGSGHSHFFQKIDSHKLRRKKLFCGYSDATLMLLYLNQKRGIISLHGPNSIKKFDEKSLSALKTALQMKNYGINFLAKKSMNVNNKKIEGITIGGNLTRINEYLIHERIDFRNKIVFLEDVEIKKEDLMNHLFNLKNYSAFSPKAILFGDLGRPLTDELKEFILELFVGIPLIFEMPFGHVSPNITIPLGVKGVIDGRNNRITFIFPESEKEYSVKF